MKRLLVCLLLVGVVGCGESEQAPTLADSLQGKRIHFQFQDQEESRELWLQLAATKVAGSGLVQLKGLTNLNGLTLYSTKVTPADVKKFQQALPNCKISRLTR